RPLRLGGEPVHPKHPRLGPRPELCEPKPEPGRVDVQTRSLGVEPDRAAPILGQEPAEPVQVLIMLREVDRHLIPDQTILVYLHHDVLSVARRMPVITCWLFFTRRTAPRSCTASISVDRRHRSRSDRPSSAVQV